MNRVMQVNARTKHKSCIYRTVDSRKQGSEKVFGKAASVSEESGQKSAEWMVPVLSCGCGEGTHLEVARAEDGL